MSTGDPFVIYFMTHHCFFPRKWIRQIFEIEHPESLYQRANGKIISHHPEKNNPYFFKASPSELHREHFQTRETIEPRAGWLRCRWKFTILAILTGYAQSHKATFHRNLSKMNATFIDIRAKHI